MLFLLSFSVSLFLENLWRCRGGGGEFLILGVSGAKSCIFNYLGCISDFFVAVFRYSAENYCNRIDQLLFLLKVLNSIHIFILFCTLFVAELFGVVCNDVFIS